VLVASRFLLLSLWFTLSRTCSYLFARYRYEFAISWNCRLCPPYMNAAETDAILVLGNSQTVEEWEKAFCDQVTGSGLFPGAKGCRILTTDSMGKFAATQVEVKSPSTDEGYGRKKGGKNLGKLTETSVKVFFATEGDLEVSDDPDSPLALAFLEDDLVYAYKKVREGIDLQKGSDLEIFSGHFLGEAKAPEDTDVLFPELSKSLRGSAVSWGYRG
jgi:hypothetical protein